MGIIVDYFRRLLGIRDGGLATGKRDHLKSNEETTTNEMKYLIAGLGNVGDEYKGTRHNAGFRIVDALANDMGITQWEDRRYGFVANGRVKNAELVLLKPSTYMNLSGRAVHYWMEKEKIPVERLLVVCDDLSLPFGKIRLRPTGSDGGHNGLKNIAQLIGTQGFSRLRFGIGNDFARGQQIDFVLGRFSEADLSTMDEHVANAVGAVKTFCLSGINIAMNQYNNK